MNKVFVGFYVPSGPELYISLESITDICHAQGHPGCSVINNDVLVQGTPTEIVDKLFGQIPAEACKLFVVYANIRKKESNDG